MEYDLYCAKHDVERALYRDGIAFLRDGQLRAVFREADQVGAGGNIEVAGVKRDHGLVEGLLERCSQCWIFGTCLLGGVAGGRRLGRSVRREERDRKREQAIHG